MYMDAEVSIALSNRIWTTGDNWTIMRWMHVTQLTCSVKKCIKHNSKNNPNLTED